MIKIFSLAIMTFWISCAARRTVVEPTLASGPISVRDTLKNTRQSLDLKMDESFDPHSLGDDGWTIRTRYGASSQTSFTGYSFDYAHNALLRDTKEYAAMGYRVQLFVSSDYYEALSQRDSAAVKFSEEIYFDYEQPYYKIRAGNFTERQQADEVRDRAKSLGYSDAWVVQTKVIVKQN